MESELVFVIGAGLAAGVGFLLGRSARERNQEATSAGVLRTEPDGDPRARLYAIAKEFEPIYQASARPEDVLEMPLFRAGVTILANPEFPLDDLLTYVAGDNSVVTSMAACALGRREDARGLCDAVLARFSGMSLYARAFALRHFELSADESLPVRFLLALDEYWNSPLGTRLARGYVQGRLVPGEIEKRGADFAALQQSHAEFLRQLVAPLEDAGAMALKALLAVSGGGPIDKSALTGIGRVLELEEPAPLFLATGTQNTALLELKAALARDPARPLLLVGEEGVGKRTLLRRLTRDLLQEGWVVFEAGAMQLIAGQSFVGQLEDRLNGLMRAMVGKPKLLWIVPDLPDLAHAGRTMQSPTSVLDLLMPHVLGGKLRIAAQLVPQAHEQLLRTHPQLRSASITVRLPAPDAAATLELGRSFVLTRANADGVELADERLLADIHQKAQQYLSNLAAPGNLLHFLTLLHERCHLAGSPARAATLDDVIVLASRLTGLPTTVIDDREGLDLDALKKHFEAKVLGQPEAVDCLVERIAMLKAGLADPRRPLGVFLFTGPTGTGKTEIARTLAEFLFGSADRLIRLDMSELQHPDGVARLVGDADPIYGRPALVHKIKEQPFAVVLFDEVEKAHPALFDLFLQLFDEGRLCDRRGVPSDFRHALIILTSNVGVRDLEGQSLGFGGKRPDLMRALETIFRRELLNRIDRIVVFRPLERGVMRRVLAKELELALARRGLKHRPWVVEWDESALEFLLEEGFTQELGARPLRRAIERHLLAPLASAIVRRTTPEGEHFLFVKRKGKGLTVEFVNPDGAEAVAEERPVEIRERPALTTIVREGTGRPAEIFAIAEHLARVRMLVEHESWQRRQNESLAAMGEDGFWSSNARYSVLGQVELMDRIGRFLAKAKEQAEQLWGKSPTERTSYPAVPTRSLAERVWLAERAISALEAGQAQDAYLAVRAVTEGRAERAQVNEFARRIAAMYRAWADRRGMTLEVLRERAGSTDPFEIVFAISGLAAFSILEHEDGLHVCRLDQPSAPSLHVRVVVVAQSDTPAHSDFPDLLSVASAREPAPVRSYRDAPSPEVRDRRRGWRTGRVERVFGGEFDVFE